MRSVLMDLPTQTILGLKLLGDGNLSLQNYKRIIESAFQLILEDENVEHVSKICPEKREIVEQAYASILTLIVHAVQVNVDDNTVREYLSGVSGLKEERVQLLVAALNSKHQAVAQKLSKIQSLPQSIVDVNWRLDYIIKSNSRNNVGEAVYLLVITTEREGLVRHIRFSCDQYQLQDLSTRLKEIVHQVETFAVT